MGNMRIYVFGSVRKGSSITGIGHLSANKDVSFYFVKHKHLKDAKMTFIVYKLA